MPSPTESNHPHGAPGTESGPETIAEGVPRPAGRKPWVRPRLECFGDVRQVTMGGTIGINESGNPTRFP